MSMSSIPHHSSSTHSPHHGLKAVAGWLWVLLAVGVLGLLLLIGWRVAHRHMAIEGAALSMAEPAATTQESLTAAPPVLDRDAEPSAGNPMPKYPADVLAAGIEGDVIARLQIDSTGRVTDAAIVSQQEPPDARLNQAALDALLQWHFHPALREGKAVASVVQVPVEFRTGR